MFNAALRYVKEHGFVGGVKIDYKEHYGLITITTPNDGLINLSYKNVKKFSCKPMPRGADVLHYMQRMIKIYNIQ